MGQSSFAEQKFWADGHINEINRVVRKVVGRIIDIVPADPERDRRDGIDYDIKVPTGTIACRIRRADKYSYRDLTLTSHRASGATPETDKILSGSVRWYLYAWAADGKFVEWMFVDLDKLRSSKLIEAALQEGNELPDGQGSKFIFISSEQLLKAGVVVDHEMKLRRVREVS